MPRYLVKQRAEVWYEIAVIAENKNDAKDLASDLLMDGVGVKVKDSFVWEDDYEVEEVR
jgi:hypothetical protein